MALGKIAGFDSVTGCVSTTPDDSGKKVFVPADDLEGQRDVHVGMPALGAQSLQRENSVASRS